MSIALNRLKRHRREIEEALAGHQEARRRLLRQDGSRRYADAEHGEREKQLLDAFDRVVTRASAAADEVEAEARRTLALLAGADLTRRLSADELDRANARAAFVREDAARLPVPTLTERCRAALADSDRAAAFLWARYCRQRVEDLLGQIRQGRGAIELGTSHDEIGALDRTIAALEDTLRDPRADEKRAAAEAVLEAADDLRLFATGQRLVADGTDERARGDVLRDLLANF